MTDSQRPDRTLLVGWFSFLHGEATAGDVLALGAVRAALERAGAPYDVAWSPGFRPGRLCLDDVRPQDYGTLVFVCGPVHGPQVAGLHGRFADCRRLAVGVSVIDHDDPAAAGFHRVWARDAPDTDLAQALPDLSWAAPPPPPSPLPPALSPAAPPVAGVALTREQGEYGERRRHGVIVDTITGWLTGLECARLPLETRLDRADPWLPRTPEQFEAVLRRVDVMVTNRLHGLVLALRNGIPALAVDSVLGGGKVTAQAAVASWPALLRAEEVTAEGLDHWWRWCTSQEGREAAREAARTLPGTPTPQLEALVDALGGRRAGPE
ncbi:polysaccharide pyruvyl transferase family protein [Allostreptomyces psammosilenae]|uniref:Polysaccharide pyruvyl transferase domain-containing protein n=1 Tax=Allostreptomyces psammosilenae TaxID=1892865 RepID=A0A852ZNZ0_9ACTN|nr:polysaccharide pyruvyl transferase family protein [Allostreptomyces psammosilenae]NYI04113.1 hypothetical protein [Allostreptomyces psammosilenae]